MLHACSELLGVGVLTQLVLNVQSQPLVCDMSYLFVGQNERNRKRIEGNLNEVCLNEQFVDSLSFLTLQVYGYISIITHCHAHQITQMYLESILGCMWNQILSRNCPVTRQTWQFSSTFLTKRNRVYLENSLILFLILMHENCDWDTMDTKTDSTVAYVYNPMQNLVT